MSSTDANVVNKRDFIISFFDGATYATSTNTYTVSGEEGDLAMGGGGTTVETFLDRGEIIGDAGFPLTRKVDDQQCTVNFSAYLRKYTNAEVATLRDIAARASNLPAAACGAAAGWSNQHPYSDAFCIGIRIGISKAGSGASGWFYQEYRYCSGSMEVADGNPATLTVNMTSATNAPTISET